MLGEHITDTQQSQEAIVINPEDKRLENRVARQLNEALMVLSNHAKPQLLQISELVAFSSTCFFFFALFRDELRQRAQNFLFQALIDATKANTTLLRHILESHPKLLDKTAPTGMVITSQLTFQSLNIGDKNLLAVALRRKQVEMLKELLPYYKKNPESRAKAIQQWHVPEVSKEEYQGYKNRISQLVDVIIDDDTITRAIFKKVSEATEQALWGLKASETTEQALKAFMDELLPDNAKPIEDYPDPLQMTIVAVVIYIERFKDFKNWAQRDIFIVRVVGLLYTLLVPEDAKVVAQGLSELGENEPGKKAQNLKLQTGEPFYRGEREDPAGQGFRFFCDSSGSLQDRATFLHFTDNWLVQARMPGYAMVGAKLEILSSAKTSKARELEEELKRDLKPLKTTPYQGM